MNLFRSWGLDGGHGQRKQHSALGKVLRDARRSQTLEVIVNAWRLRGNAWTDTAELKGRGVYLWRFALGVASTRGAGHGLE
jgi:hypothetical protein